MFGFFKNKFDKDAQAAIERRARQMAPDKAPRPAAGSPVNATSQTRDAAIAQVKAQAQRVMTPERQALIAQAMAVHKAKQKILADLDDESRAKLVAMAITTLLHSEVPSDPPPKPKKK